MSLQYLQKEVKGEADVSHADKHQSFKSSQVKSNVISDIRLHND